MLRAKYFSTALSFTAIFDSGYRRYRRYRRYSGYGLLGMWAWWDGGDKKVGFAEEKAASRRKSRLRRKKTAPVGVAWGSVGIKGGVSLPGGFCHDRPSEAHCYSCSCLQAALQALPRLHGVVHNMPSPMAGVIGR